MKICNDCGYIGEPAKQVLYSDWIVDTCANCRCDYLSDVTKCCQCKKVCEEDDTGLCADCKADTVKQFEQLWYSFSAQQRNHIRYTVLWDDGIEHTENTKSLHEIYKTLVSACA